ncbi:MAG: PilZ domain-containing protein [Nitrospira sp.]
MNQIRQARRVERQYPHRAIERRSIRRVSVSFGLMYSGFNGEDVLVGDGTVIDLSDGGIGIRGNSAVQIGMDLTLFLYLPYEEDPLFILEATVAWTSGSLFGATLKELSLPEGDRMRLFLQEQSVGQA